MALMTRKSPGRRVHSAAGRRYSFNREEPMPQPKQHPLGPLTTFEAAAMYQQMTAPIKRTRKNSKRALSRAIANRDAR
jgi:hypothetical protein